MDELTSYLLNDRQQTRLAPETLEIMGKQAAAMYLDEGLSLNKAVVKVASGSDANQEHINRICEFANTEVYLRHHDKNKTAGAASSYPQFELADPSAVSKEMRAASIPKVASVSADYSRHVVRKEKMASSDADSLLGEMFGSDSSEGEPTFTTNSAVTEIYEAKDSLIGLKDNLEGSAEKLAMMRTDAEEEYYGAVKQFMLEGGSFSNVVAAARSTGADYEKVAQALRPTMERLMREKVASFEQLKEQTTGFEKIAHRIVNPEHPLSSVFAGMLTLDSEIEKVAVSLEDVDSSLKDVNVFIKEHFHARAAQ
jgi:hypothetical protein